MSIKNVLWQPLYDSVLLVTATARDYDFFKVPVGQSDGTITKTRFHTNSDIAGQIPNGQKFVIFGVGVSLWTNTAGGSTYDDAQAILERSQAYLHVEIRNVVYFELPLFKFTSGHGIQVNNATTVAATSFRNWTNGDPNPKSIYTLVPKPITIPENTPYNLKVRFESAPTIATAGTRMFVFLEGVMKEPVYK